MFFKKINSDKSQMFPVTGCLAMLLVFLSAGCSTTINTDNQIGIFGTDEIQSADFSQFTKWDGVQRRFADDLKLPVTDSGVQKWAEALRLAQLETTDMGKLETVNDYFNAVTYAEDIDVYHEKDYWATPIEFLNQGKGDCEDYAIAKYEALKALGFKDDQLRIAVVQDKIKRTPHVVLIVFLDGNKWVLDNQSSNIKYTKDVTRYQIIYSINTQNWWRHVPHKNV